MLYAKILPSGELDYPYDLGKLRSDFPDTSFPQDVTLMGDLHLFQVFPVAVSEPPLFDPATERLDEDEPVAVNGTLTQRWRVRPATQDELDLAAQKLAAQQQAAEDAAIRTTAKLDGTILYLLTHTAAEIEAKVASDVTNLAAAKTFIAKLAVAVGVLARHELR